MKGIIDDGDHWMDAHKLKLIDYMVNKKDCWGKYLRAWDLNLFEKINVIETPSNTISEKACFFIFGDMSPNCLNCGAKTPFIKFDTAKRLPKYRACCDKHCQEEYLYHERKKLIEAQLATKVNHVYISGDYMNRHFTNKIRIRHLRCGSEFEVSVGNFIQSKNLDYCPVCGGKERASKATKSVVDRCDDRDAMLYEKHGIDKKTYIRLVRRETAKTYKMFKEYINPLNLKIARAGQADAFHVDHIVSIVASYELDVPIHPKVLGSVINLQMMEGLENITKGKSVEEVPTGLLEDLRRISKSISTLRATELNRLLILNRDYGSLDGVKIEFR